MKGEALDCSSLLELSAMQPAASRTALASFSAITAQSAAVDSRLVSRLRQDNPSPLPGFCDWLIF